MFKTSRTIVAVVAGSLLMPMLALAEDTESGANDHKIADLLWGVAPFIVLGILFWFFFIRQIRKQQTSPLVKRHQAYMDAHEQHMKRMEQLTERLVAALEKGKQ